MLQDSLVPPSKQRTLEIRQCACQAESAVKARGAYVLLDDGTGLADGVVVEMRRRFPGTDLTIGSRFDGAIEVYMFRSPSYLGAKAERSVT